jgi:hypothetical protein
MKKAILPLLLMLSFWAHGQNYQCLQAGVKHYFINANGYLRGIRIDSTQTLGDTTVFYPFHTPRGAYDPYTPMPPIALDSAGGSWLGKRVLQLADGTFIFDRLRGDSVIIKSQAAVGDTWVLYRDSSTLYYKATVVSVGWMPVLGTPDSVKNIMINAYNDTGLVTSDPLDSFVIMLSKNHGFTQVMDLYNFPYHLPDSTYHIGLDFYLDRSTSTPLTVNNPPSSPVGPNRTVTLFHLIDFVNPTEQQMYNWNVGDIIESDNELGIPLPGPVTITRLADTVTDRVVVGHMVHCTISGSSFTCPSMPFYPCGLICKAGIASFSDTSYPIIDTTHMPEEAFYWGGYIFYYPSDTSYCSHNPAYKCVMPHYNYPLGWVNESVSYKLGIGKTDFEHQDGDPTFETDRLLYYNIAGTACGSPFPSGIIDPLAEHLSVAIAPNPANGEIVITNEYGGTYTASLQNQLGQTISTVKSNNVTETISVAEVPAGVYNVVLVSANGERSTQKIVVLH